MAMTPDELIDTSMMLIVHSGDARAAAFHALQEAKAGNYEEAKKLMEEKGQSYKVELIDEHAGNGESGWQKPKRRRWRRTTSRPAC